MMDNYNDVLEFWFEELQPKDWFVSNSDLDKQITQKFAQLHQRAIQCELVSWRCCAQGRLAEIIVLDQFSRNMFRDSPFAFACDSQALVLAQEAVLQGVDLKLSEQQRSFLYMPYMHSESLLIHEHGLRLFTQSNLQQNREFHLKHTAILEQFGRYPHRNKVLGRQSSAEELEFLTQPDSFF
ncbi:hypothetical protein A9264_10925 [Vibrio sp. UCD-FRSSP16_10]|uniref:DUF924 family protein n=1 Tax=unclassified Vibrio TaxID=2614977 RepID=UPI0007FEDA13|nr:MULTISPECIES: DUF924 family protein [unclassified Vibrio]OBT16775.1 hypothetical protein A9260_11145 [Vibrio sp. UCD-FRSSP16_30]OBT21402.1 hypothetical protein A9264_10925 [Vibrio sp. UCD-FRSSP16_10]